MAELPTDEIEKSRQEIDRSSLSPKDSDFHPHDWEELKIIIAQNNLSVLRRWPSDFKRYVKWTDATKKMYGTVPNFIMSKRLKWTPVDVSPSRGPTFDSQSGIPFDDDRDYKIMPNDWPYGLADGITHIIVWLKTRLEVEPTWGDLTDASREQVRNFVQETFVNRVQSLPGPEDKVMWFRNWTALQSVPGMEHIHVLVRDVPEDIILEWTKGEIMQQG